MELTSSYGSEQGSELTDEFNTAASDCETATGLTDAQRAREVLIQQALLIADPDGVRAYAAILTTALEQPGAMTP